MIRVSVAAFALLLLRHDGVASFSPFLPFRSQRTQMYMEPPIDKDTKLGTKPADRIMSGANHQNDSSVIGGSNNNVRTAAEKRKGTNESDVNIFNGEGGLSLGETDAGVAKESVAVRNNQAQASEGWPLGYNGRVRTNTTAVDLKGSEAIIAVNGEDRNVNNLDGTGNPSSETTITSEKRDKGDGEGISVSEGADEESNTDATPSAPFFASVDARKESARTNGRSLTETGKIQETKQTEGVVPQSTFSTDNDGLGVKRNETMDVNVNGAVGSFVKLSSTGAEPNDAVRDKEERKRRYMEYKSTSMQQLRQDVGKAKEKSTEAKDRVATMQQRVDVLQKELDFAEDEFQLYLVTKEEESESITSQVGELESLVQAREDRQKQEEDKVKAAGNVTQNKLLKEIEEKKFALCQAREELNDLVEASTQIQSRLDQTKAQGISEKAAFENDEAKMKAVIREQKTKLTGSQARIQEERDLFEEECTSLGRMLQEQITRVAETNARIQLEQSMYSTNQIEIQRNIDDITSKLRATEEEIQAQKENSTKETNELRSTVRNLRQMLAEAEDKLESKQTMSRKIQEDLQMKSVFEKVKAQNLASDLERQQMRYRREMKDLETEFAANRSELEKAESLLDSTRAAHLRESNMMKDQIADSERIRKLKAKEMSQRFRNIRAELTSLWQEERKKARKEQKELHEKYSKRLFDLQGSVPQLERKVTEAQQSTEALRIGADKVMKERASIMEEGRLAEMRYMQAKQNRNVAISALENELDVLYDDIAERNEKLASYKSSLRVLLKLSIRLTRERIRAARKRIFSRFRRKRKPNKQGSQSSGHI